MTDTITRLKNGDCLCPSCRYCGPHYQTVKSSHIAPERTICDNGCEHDNGNAVEVITFADVRENFPNFSHEDFDWLNANHPDLAAEGKRMGDAI